MNPLSPPAFNGLVYVLGPSGAGKDSVIDWLLSNWAGPVPLHRARRTITRPAHAGGEDHESLDTASFLGIQQQGGFAMHWAAHGLLYGVRQSELACLAQGACVLVNGSRAHLQTHSGLLAHAAVLHITASVDTLSARLLSRQREEPEGIRQRLLRTAQLPPIAHPLSLTIHNDGPLPDAGAATAEWLQQLLSTRH